MKIKADDLAATVEKTLSDYVEDVNDVVKQEIKDAGKAFVHDENDIVDRQVHHPAVKAHTVFEYDLTCAKRFKLHTELSFPPTVIPQGSM